MKKLFTITALLLATVTLVIAQPPQRGRASAEDQAKRSTESLEKLVTLTAEQKEKVQEINLDIAKQTQGLQRRPDDGNPSEADWETVRKKMQELNETRDAKYKEVLTEEQYKKYIEDKEKREKEMQQRRGPGQGQGGPRNR